MHIAFTDDRPDVVIAATGAVVDDEAVDLGTVGRDVVTAALQWRPGSRLIMTGSLEGKRDTELEVRSFTAPEIPLMSGRRHNTPTDGGFVDYRPEARYRSSTGMDYIKGPLDGALWVITDDNVSSFAH